MGMEKKDVRHVMGITQEAIRFSELRSPIPDVPSPTRSLSHSLCADADAASTTYNIMYRSRFILLDVLHELSLIDHKLLINYIILS